MKIYRKENNWQPGQTVFEDGFVTEVLSPIAAEEMIRQVVARFQEDAPSRKVITCSIDIPPASIRINYTEDSK